MTHGRALGALLLPALLATGARAEGVLRIDPARSAVRFTLAATLHTVHGEGRVVSGELRFDPAGGPASGAVVVDARSFATGIDARDRDMHAKVLESERFGRSRSAGSRGSTARASGTGSGSARRWRSPPSGSPSAPRS